MKRFLENIDKYLKFYFLISIIISIAAIILLAKRVYKIETYLANLPTVTTESGDKKVLTQNIDTCGDECKRIINDTVGKAVSTISGTTKSVVKTKTVPAPSQNQTAYIPLAGPITTTSTGWVDAIGTDVYIDLANDYGQKATVSWETFLSVVNGNGQAYARLFDVTHGIAVDGSEISTSSGTQTQVSSGGISLWAGQNLYRVQLKSLNSFVVTFGSGRIKINY